MFVDRSKPTEGLELERVRETLFQHQYIYKERIGAGAFASVHLVQSIKWQQTFAVKLIRLAGIVSNISEIDTLMKATGTNIIKMYEHFADDTYEYIILEYCPGGSLQALVKKEGPMPKEKLYPLCVKCLEALKQCHDRNIAHRDIKPANVLIDSWGRIKIADFGLSKIITGEQELLQFAGTKPYMSPELFLKTAVDPFAADIYALGITFFYFAYGKLPWTAVDNKGLELQITMGMLSFPKFPKHEHDFQQIIRAMTRIRPSTRATLEDLIDAEIFQPYHTPKGLIPTSMSSFKIDHTTGDGIPNSKFENPKIPRVRSVKSILKSQNMRYVSVSVPPERMSQDNLIQAKTGPIPSQPSSRKREINFLLKAIAKQTDCDHGNKDNIVHDESKLPHLNAI